MALFGGSLREQPGAQEVCWAGAAGGEKVAASLISRQGIHKLNVEAYLGDRRKTPAQAELEISRTK